jgi:CRISPR-associated endoribonuclease Cas6
MRIKITLSSEEIEIPISLKHAIPMGYLHKCFDGLNYHGKYKYSISPLIGGVFNEKNKTLNFSNGKGYFIISSLYNNVISDFLMGAIKNKDVGYGLKVNDIQHMTDSLYKEYNYFLTLSHILIREKGDYYLYDDDSFVEKLSENTKRRLLAIDKSLDLNDFKIEMVECNINKKQKIYLQKTELNNPIIHWGSLCSLKIFSNKKVAKILLDVGLGNSCGYGFGAIYPSINNNKY